MFLATGKAETQLATSPLMLYSCFKLLTSLLTSPKTLWYSTCAEDELPRVCRACRPHRQPIHHKSPRNSASVSCGGLCCMISTSIFHPVLVWTDALIGPCPSVVIIMAKNIGGVHSALIKLLTPALRNQVISFSNSDA